MRNSACCYFLTTLLAIGIANTTRAVVVTPFAVTSSGSNSFANPNSLINGSGLDVNDLTGLHDNADGGGTMWIADEGGGPAVVDNQFLVFDLGGNYDLTNAHIWQNNQTGFGFTGQLGLERGVATLGMETSSDGVNYSAPVNITLNAPSPGPSTEVGLVNEEPVQTFDLIASDVQFVRFDINTALSGNANEYVGLSEVKFSGTLLTSANPEFVINRDTGNITLHNNTAGSINFVAYDIDSPAAGALDASNWNSIAGNYDAGNPGANQVSTDDWIEFSPAPFIGNLGEGEQPGGSGATLGVGDSIDFGDVWIRNPTQDLAVRLLREDGSLLTSSIEYTGDDIVVGDYSGNGTIGAEDWPLFRSGLGNTGEGLSQAQAFGLGDLDGDGDTDLSDFRQFETLYDNANGAGALQGLIATQVPEPASVILLVAGALLALVASRGRPVLQQAAVTKCLSILMTLAAAALLLGSQEASAQTFTLTSPATPSGATANSEFGGNFVVGSLFDDATLTGADIGIKAYDGGSLQYAGVGADPKELFLDFGQSVSANYLAFAQRVGGDALADKIGQIELWFSDTDFGAAIPAAAADKTVEITELSGRITPYTLGDVASGRYVAARLTISDLSAGQPVNNIGGNEFRLATGPSDIVLEVDRSTGSMTIVNNGSMAQSLDINGYEIRSSGRSLLGSWSGFEEGSVAGFDAGDGSGNGWEKGDLSNQELLSEAYLLGSSTLAPAASLALGAGYDTTVDAQDLQFSISIQNGNGLLFPGVVNYVGDPGGVLFGDADNDGAVAGSDLLAVTNNFGNTGVANGLLLGDADDDGAVAGSDLLAVTNNFGSTLGSASLGGSQAIPEPSTAAIALIAGVAVSWFQRRKTMSKLLAAAVALVTISVASPLLAATPDAIYLFGDNSSSATENGAANTGVGQAPGTDFADFTLDHAGELSNGTFRDLEALPNAAGQRPVYVDTAALNFPGTSLGATSTGVGIRFDGIDDRLSGVALGNPGDGDSTFSGDAESAYANIFGRMIDGWVRPTTLDGSRQDVVNDSDQFGIHITENNTWGFTYSATDYDTGVDVAGTLDAAGWAHVHHISTGSDTRLLVNGETALQVSGFFGGTDGAAIVFGSNLAGDANHYTGDLDNFRLSVFGDNSSSPNGANYGGINLLTDNDFITASVVPGDANGDGVVNGDGTGNESVDDVSFFVNHYFETQVINGAISGDLTSITTLADLDGSGRTDLLDWHILRTNHQNVAALEAVDLGALLAARSTGVPEPSTVALAFLALAGATGANYYRRR